MGEFPFLFLVLLVRSGGSTPLSCPEAIVDQWDNLTNWDDGNLTLTLSLDNLSFQGRNCSFDGEEELEVFALEQFHNGEFKCNYLREGVNGVRKFFYNHDNNVYVLPRKKENITFEFISGNLVFRLQKKLCTEMKSYNSKINGNTLSAITSNQNKECKSTQNNPTIAPGLPSWNDGICSLTIETYQLPKCYMNTNYTRASVYLVAVEGGNCTKSGRNLELNPLWPYFFDPLKLNPNISKKKQTLFLNKQSEIKHISFSNLTEDLNYCLFVSMWDNYPICKRGDLCYFYGPPNTSFKCSPRPRLEKAGAPVTTILISSCGIILIVCLLLLVKLKKKIKINLNTKSASPLPISRASDATNENCKIYVLYYPNNEVTNEDINQITGQNNSLITNLNSISDSDKNVTIIDIVEKICLDEIQDTSGIEMDLSSGQAKCVLILTPSAKRLFDHIKQPSKSPNPLDQDLLDGSARNVIMPLFKHLLNIQNVSTNMYQTIGCVRFDRNDMNAGDQININTLKRMSLPSDGRELAEWALVS